MKTDKNLILLVMALGLISIVFGGVIGMDFAYILMTIFLGLGVSLVIYGIYCFIKGER